MDPIEYLVKLGKAQGFVTYRDFREALSYQDIDEEEKDIIFEMLKGMGIEVKMRKAEIVNINGRNNAE